MKKKFLGLICFFQIIILLGAAQKKIDYIVFYKPGTVKLETNHYTMGAIKIDFNSQYENVKKSNIRNDLAEALKHNDYRFIAISGNSYIWPGLMGYIKYKGNEKGYGVLKKYERYLDKYKFKVVYGTSDMIDENRPPLQDAAADYAEKYNEMLLVKLDHLQSKPH